MKYLKIALIACAFQAYGQIVPFPTDPVDPAEIEPWGYTNKGTNWDTSPYLPFVYKYNWFRLMPPNGVTYDESLDTWNFPAGEEYPIILFFHGAGERGDDNNNQLKHGGRRHRDAVLSDEFPGFLLYPQNVDKFSMMEILAKLIEIGVPIDKTKIYAHGLSNGAKFTWEFALEFPHLVAGIFPMSGVVAEDDYSSLVYTPIRLAQGGRDRNPNPSFAQQEIDKVLGQGGHLEYFFLPNTGHGTWNQMYYRDDFFTKFLEHKVNRIYAKYDYYEICPGDPIDVTLGVNPGHGGYEWMKDNVLMDGVDSHEIAITEFGSYQVRVSLDSSGVWTDWSEPLAVTVREGTQTPPIALDPPNQSVIIPDPNGDEEVTVSLPEGFDTYEWFDVNDNLISNEREIAVGEGTYRAKVAETFSCSSFLSEDFIVIRNSGIDVPSTPEITEVTTLSKTELLVNWTDNSTNETGFELYKRKSLEEPYEFVALVGADITSFNDTNLDAGTVYYYSIRSINNNGSSVISSDISGETDGDRIPPTIPSDLSIVRTSAGSISLIWTESTDDVELRRYNIYQDSVKVMVSSVPEVTVFNLVEDDLYTFNVTAVDASGNESGFSNRVVGTASQIGLNYRYYEGSWTELPDFTLGGPLTPIKTGQIEGVDISPRNRDDNFAFYWEGFISIPETGIYTFYTRSDDGSKLYIGGYDESNRVVDNDGLHGSRERFGLVSLTEGFYPIVITFFERTGGQRMEVRWSGPGFSKQLIPNSAFSKAQDIPNDLIAEASNVTLTPESYQRVSISWDDNSSEEIAYQVFRSLTSNEGFELVGSVPTDSTSFEDTGLNPSTTYYYKILTAGSSSELITVEYPVTTLAVSPPDPILNFTSTAVSVDSVYLSWDAPLDDVFGFNLYRVDGSTTLLATLGEDVLEYYDTGLEPHTEYQYLIESFNPLENSAMSQTMVTTLNNNPVLSTVVPNLNLQHKDLYELAIEARDLDGDSLIYENIDGYGFISFEERNDTTYMRVEPQLGDVGNYVDVGIRVSDKFGGSSAIETFNIDVVENLQPEITLSEYFLLDEFNGGDSLVLNVFAEELRALNFSFTDPESDDLEINSVNVPAFGSLQFIDEQTATLVLEPTLSDVAIYQVELTANDGKTITSFKFTINVVVRDENTPDYLFESVLINFGGPGQSVSLPLWNHLLATPTSSTSLLDLIDSEGNNTGFGITLATTWSNYANEGAVTGDDSGVFPDIVMNSFLADGTSNPMNVSLTGLDVNKVYDIVFFGSYSSKKKVADRVSVYSSSQKVDSLIVNENTNRVASLNGLRSDGSGTLTFEVSSGVSTTWKYLNAIQIRYYDEPSISNAPSDLIAAAESSTKINLRWSDNSTNETHFELYRKRQEDIDWVLVTTTPENITTYSDENLAPNTLYQYRVRSINGVGASSYSTVVSEPTYSDNSGNVLLINFTSKRDLFAPTPWNNFYGAPRAGLGYNNLLNISGITTPYGLELVDSWDFGTVRGVSTGNDSGVYPDDVMLTYFTQNDATDTRLKLVGLDINELYDLSFFASVGNIGNDRITQFIINGEARGVNVRDNSTERVIFYGVQPEIDGTITIAVNYPSGSFAAKYINAMEVKYYTEPIVPFAPINLTASTVSHDIIDLNWTDVSSNESGFEIYRSSANDNTWSLIHTTAPDVTQFSDTGLNDDTQYLYRLRSINGSGQSEYSSTATARTLVYEPFEFVNINFYHRTDIDFGPDWNTFVTNPLAGATIQDMTNLSGINTGFDISLVNSWSYGSNRGEVTGDNSGIFPDDIMRTHFVSFIAGGNDILLSDLDNTKLYDIKLFSSIDNRNSIITYTINGVTQELSANNNTSNAIDFLAVVPDVNNQIQIHVGYSPSGLSPAYINALQIRYYDEPSVPFSPENFSASVLAYDEIKLNWRDVSTNEDGFEIHRSADGGNSWELVATTSPDAEEYIDEGLQASTSYSYRIRSVNGNGESDYTEVISLTTFEFDPYEYVLINFTHTSTPGGEGWNDFNSNPVAGAGIENLVNTNAVETNFDISLVNAWNYGTPYGSVTGDNSGIYPDAVLASNYLSNIEGGNQILLDQLDPDKLYDLSFLGNRANQAATTRFTIGGVSKDLSTRDNTTEVVSFSSLSPKPDGTITILVEYVDIDFKTAYLNAMEIRYYDEPIVPFTPELVSADALSSSEIALQWVDNSSNETGFNVFRSLTGIEGSWSQIGSTASNSTTYNDSGLESNVLYYYRVEAANANGSSPSNVVSQSTYIFTSYVNFNEETSAPYPWNNFDRVPGEGEALTNVINTSGGSTGIDVILGAGWSGNWDLAPFTSLIYPNEALYTYYFVFSPESAYLILSNLNLTHAYDLSFYSNWENPAGGNTSFQVGEDVTTHENTYLNYGTVTLRDLRPNEDGQIVIKVSAETDALLNGLEINVSGGYAPSSRVASNGSETAAKNIKEEEVPEIISIPDLSSVATIYPIPAGDVINIELSDVDLVLEEPVNVSIIDLSGRVLLSENNDLNDPRFQLNVRHIREGSYMLILKNSNIQITKRILIKR